MGVDKSSWLSWPRQAQPQRQADLTSGCLCPQREKNAPRIEHRAQQGIKASPWSPGHQPPLSHRPRKIHTGEGREKLSRKEELRLTTGENGRAKGLGPGSGRGRSARVAETVAQEHPGEAQEVAGKRSG